MNMTFQEIQQRIDLAQPFIYTKELELSGNTADDTEELTIGHQDFFCTHRVVVGLDSAGIMVSGSVDRDLVTLEIKDQNGKNFQNDPFEIFTLNERIGNPALEGWYIANRSILTIKATGKDFPTAAEDTFPIKYRVQFHGYNLK
jgi:hypothetical protein